MFDPMSPPARPTPPAGFRYTDQQRQHSRVAEAVDLLVADNRPRPLSVLERVCLVVAMIKDMLIILVIVGALWAGGRVLSAVQDARNGVPNVSTVGDQPCLGAPAGTPGCGL